MDVYVLTGGELFYYVLNFIALFFKGDSLQSLLKIVTLASIIMLFSNQLKTRDRKEIALWFLGYVLITSLIALPKTTVYIQDITAAKTKQVDNIPVFFAFPISFISKVGYGLAEIYDEYTAMPDDLQYTKTGMLFGSKLIVASHDFKIINPDLKKMLDAYFQSCVVGDIRINRKYSLSELANSQDIYSLITKKPSPVRGMKINGDYVSCQDAVNDSKPNSLKKQLDKEIEKAYIFYGIPLFGKKSNDAGKDMDVYRNLFNTQLTSAYDYYQNLSDSSSNIFLQSMMINAIHDGINHYQSLQDNTSSIVSYQFSKSQVQHRWSWKVMSEKSIWFLPLLHTVLMILLFGIFPLVFVFISLPSGHKILIYYFQFFISLQIWPILFAILNQAMTVYGKSHSIDYDGFNLINLNKMDELHADISNVAGYIMIFIPFLSYGLITSIGSSFNGLATSMTGHLQSSAMGIAGETTGGSFSLGQTSFNNSNSNNISSNKHDANWTDYQGMYSEQLSSGTIKTTTGEGGTVYDVSPSMSKNGLSINMNEALSGAMNEAYEHSVQSAFNASDQMQTSLSGFAHKAMQLSHLSGEDMRFGDGISDAQTNQFSHSIATVTGIASDVAKKNGITTEDALTHLTSVGANAHAGFSSSKTIGGKFLELTSGFNASVDGHLKFERSSTGSLRGHEGHDIAVSGKQMEDFNEAYQNIKSFSQSHHFDNSLSKGSQLSNQMGADLRQAESSNHQFDAALSESHRINDAKTYMETEGAQINANMDQAFSNYVGEKMGNTERDRLFSHPGDMNSIGELNTLAHDFIQFKKDELISQYGNQHDQSKVDDFYEENKNNLSKNERNIESNFNNLSEPLQNQMSQQDEKLSMAKERLNNNHEKNSKYYQDTVNNKENEIKEKYQNRKLIANKKIEKDKQHAKEGAVLFNPINDTKAFIKNLNKEN